jgi:dihydropteridine reductase
MSRKSLGLGGSGALGKAIISALTEAGSWTMCVDYNSNPLASANLSPTLSPEVLALQLKQALQGGRLDSVISVAGGWTGGNLQSPTLLQDAQKMYTQSVESSLLACHLASQFLKEYVVVMN